MVDPRAVDHARGYIVARRNDHRPVSVKLRLILIVAIHRARKKTQTHRFRRPRAPANPGDPANLFNSPVYIRGAMTLQALRQKIGDDKFFTILRIWYRDNRYGNVTTADFVASSEKISGTDLDPFFTRWLYTAGEPTSW
jgi:aminopeptidase N